MTQLCICCCRRQAFFITGLAYWCGADVTDMDSCYRLVERKRGAPSRQRPRENKSIYKRGRRALGRAGRGKHR